MTARTISFYGPFRRKPALGDWLVLTAIIVVAVMAAFPLVWMVLASLETPAETMRTPPVWFPATPNLNAYGQVAGVIDAGRSFINSAIVATVTTAGILLTSLLAGFAFAKYEFRGSSWLFAAVIATMFLPPIITLIPLYRLMRAAGLLNTYWAMIVPGVAFLIPTATWLLRTYMMRIPRELDEAAWVDGASRLYTLRRVILPIAMPGIMVVAITTFIGAYAQQFIFALTFNSKTEYMPLSIGLFAYFGRQEVVWNELMAASFVGIAPVMIVIFFLQRYLVAGLTAGAVKQ